MYAFEVCSYCEQAKRLLDALNLEYEVEVISSEELQELSKRTNFKTVPQIFINDQLVGGFDDLSALYKSGELETLARGKNV